MSRHPLPPFQKRRRFILCLALVLVALQCALWRTAQVRRELIRQQNAWRVPSNMGVNLSISRDGRRLTCNYVTYPPHREWTRIIDTHTGDAIEDKPASPTATALHAEVASEMHQSTRAWLPILMQGDSRRIRLKRNGRTSILKTKRLVFSTRNVLEALHLSLDGKRLTILGQTALWQMDAQTQLVTRVVYPEGDRNKYWGAEWDNGFHETASLSPDGKYIVALNPKPTLYSARTGRTIRAVGGELASWCGGCGCVEPQTGFSPDGKLMWASEEDWGGNVAFWRVSDGKKVWHRVLSMWVFDPSGKYLIDTDGLYDVSTGKIVRRLKHFEHPDKALFSRDDRSLYVLGEGGLICRYNVPGRVT